MRQEVSAGECTRIEGISWGCTRVGGGASVPTIGPMSNPAAANSANSSHAPAVGELPSRYVPAEHETRVWEHWLKARAFAADPAAVLSGARKPYSIVIPPPNVTAALHLGHALNNTLQDILARAHRMRGFETLWMPGTDHAGIATQAVVEKRVQKEEGKRRKDFTRDAFVEKIQLFKDEYEAVITGQLKKMGCSCDWDRQRFTMDPQCARAVYEAFFTLFKDGLIYRGKRLVNWDPALQTAVADDECYEEELESAFYYMRYPLVHSARVSHVTAIGRDAELEDAQPVTWNELARRGYPGADAHPGEEPAWVTVATTRPETYFADTAVAMNPHDTRAAALKGLRVELPLVGRVIPIVTDDYVVLPKAMAEALGRDEDAKDAKAEFATGFLKVTPAHDNNDYELGRRHDLPLVNMMSPDGRISDKHGWTDTGDAHVFLGKTMAEGRKLVVKEFESRQLLEKTRAYRQTIKFSDRSKAVVEPYLSDQWYVKVTDERLAVAANNALVPAQRTESCPMSEVATDHQLTFHPARYSKTYEHWHNNIRDWCISRQLWWGHRIPVWRSPATELAAEEKARFAGDRVATGMWSGMPMACIRSEHDAEAIGYFESRGWTRDPDVLDTWFSSALWPLSTMGWPDKTPLLEAFNPTSCLCTAREIITLWVSRMTMFNRYLLGAGGGKGPVPFHDVFIHAVIQDGEGRKMSKSLGNGVDPLDIIESHGADAMRFTLCHMTTQTQDVRMPVQKDSKSGKNTSPKFDLGRNFANKLWNASRFAMGILAAAAPADAGTTVRRSELSLPDRWMLARLAAGVERANEALATYHFNVYAETCYELLWNDFCDWYLEAIKPTAPQNAAQRAVLRTVLDAIVRLLHPVMPFVTEALHERLQLIPAPRIEGLELGSTAPLLCSSSWPVAGSQLRDGAAEAEFTDMQSLVKVIREVRAQHNVKPKRKTKLHAPAGVALIADEAMPLAITMAELSGVVHEPAPANAVPFNFGKVELKLSDLTDEATLDVDAEVARLEKLIADKNKSILTLEGRLNNPGYSQKAPPHMVEQTRDELSKNISERDAAKHALERIKR